MAATVTGIHLGPDTHANRPAASSGIPVGSFYYCTDHDLMYITDGSSWSTYLDNTGIGSGGVATDAIWDAAGDLAVGSGANTAAKLALGASGTVPRSNGSTLAYALPPGHEYNYTEKTSNTSITATTEAGATTIVTASAGIALDGSTVVFVEGYFPYIEGSSANGDNGVIMLFDDTGGGAASLGRAGQLTNPVGANGVRWPSVTARVRLTPSNATHTFSFRMFRVLGDWTVAAGAGGSGNYMPVYIRVTKG